MDSSIFKTAMVGGFDRQSVVDYIEKTAKESGELTERLQKELETLREEKTALETEAVELRQRVQRLEKENTTLAAEASTHKTGHETCARQLEELRPRMEELEIELECLRPEAEAYARVKAHIGDIECSAQKRADELEAMVMERLAGMLGRYKDQYKELVSAFEVTSSHVVGELRKIEVNLSQLPVTFDKMNGELSDLENVLKKK